MILNRCEKVCFSKLRFANTQKMHCLLFYSFWWKPVSTKLSNQKYQKKIFSNAKHTKNWISSYLWWTFEWFVFFWPCLDGGGFFRLWIFEIFCQISNRIDLHVFVVFVVFVIFVIFEEKSNKRKEHEKNSLSKIFHLQCIQENQQKKMIFEFHQ